METGTPLTQQASTQIGTFDVPAADSADNTNWGDVIGSKTDTYAGDSVYSRVAEIYDGVVQPRLVYPTLANGVAVVSANLDWVYGAYATIVPASTITDDFHILAVSIEACDRDATFQLELYSGAADDIVTAVRFNVTGGFFGNQVYVIGSKHTVADSRIRARLASSNGLAQIATIALSIIYYIHV